MAGGREEWINEIMKAKAALGAAEIVEKTTDGTLLNVRMVSLRKNLTDFFSESELQTLCFDLNMDYENLPGATKEEKARELVIQCERNGQVNQLIKQCKKLRPSVNW
jgi:hypothetical protein